MWSNLGISLHFPSVCVSACVHASAQVCVCVRRLWMCVRARMHKDTLQGRVPDVVPRHGGGVEAQGAGELAHQLVLEVLPAFVLLAPVDEHLVLHPAGGGGGTYRDC